MANYIRKLKQNRKEHTAIDEYFELQDEFEKKFGDKTIVFYENGHFYEFYQIHNDTEKLGKAGELADLLNMQLSKKDKSVPEVSKKNPQMAGFPSLALRRHLPIVLENGWTVVMVEQISTPPNPDRAITGIYSKGTYLDNIDDVNTNYLMSIYMESVKSKTGDDGLLCGWTIIDLSTGFLIINQIDQGTYTSTLEEIYRVIISYKPKEYIVNSDCMTKAEFEDYFNVTELLHFNEEKMYQDYWKISFQNQLFAKVWNTSGLIQPIDYLDLEQMDYARVSLILLLQFCEKHGEQIIKNLYKPEIWKSDTFLKLENNAVEQLDIFNKNDKCLFGLINRTTTSMGKRLLHHRLLMPVYNEKILNTRYEIVDEFMDEYKEIESTLRNINDLERLTRRISLNCCHPYEIANLHLSYNKVDEVFTFLKDKKSFKLIVESLKYSNKIAKIMSEFEKIREFLSDNFILEEMIKYNIKNIAGNFLKTDEPILNKYLDRQNEIHKELQNIAQHLGSLINEPDSVKYDSTDKEGFYFKCTIKKGETLQKKLEKANDFNGFKISNLKSDNKIKSCCKLVSKELDIISSEFMKNEEKIIKINQEKFQELLEEINKRYIDTLSSISRIVAEVDFYKCLAKIAVEYKYTKPIIETSDASFIDGKSVRHPIVERVNTNIPFVANDVKLGVDNQDGVLIYGINGIGKSVYLKSIALCIILAQIGSFVPANTFVFCPFRSIMTRILSNDNLYKGYSSFMVEMIELKSILHKANKFSLALADELTHGTETQSGTAIMCATIQKLSESECKFCFTSHLHQLSKMDRILKLENVRMYHMKVEYNQEKDELVYHRHLIPGAGIPLYGLECCKGLHLDKDFLNLAMEIRKEILGDEKLILNPENKSNYNNDVYLAGCEICGKTNNLQSHHIVEQQFSDKQGYQDYIHQNAAHNLISLCDECHKHLHKGYYTIAKIDTSQGFRKVILSEKRDMFSKLLLNRFTDKEFEIIMSYKDKLSTNLAARFLLSEHKIKVSEKTLKKYWSMT